MNIIKRSKDDMCISVTAKNTKQLSDGSQSTKIQRNN